MYPYLELEKEIKSVFKDLRLPDFVLKSPNVSEVDWTIDIKSIFDLNKDKFTNIKETSDFIYKKLKEKNISFIKEVSQHWIFINLIVTDDYIRQILNNIPDKKILPGYLKINAIVDYSSPNIAKQMSMWHFRATILWDVFANILQQLDAKVIRWNYIGDWGTPFWKLIYSYLYFMNFLKNPEKVEELPDDIKQKVKEIWIGQDFINNLEKNPIGTLWKLYAFFKDIPDSDKEEKARYYFKKLSDKDPEYVALWETFRKISLEEFQKIYDILWVKFDIYEWEYYAEKYVPQVIDDLEKQGYLIDSQGAKIVVFKKVNEEFVPLKKDQVNLKEIQWNNNNYEILLMKKKDGTTLYATRDLAMIWIRTKKINADKIYYIVWKEQTLHFKLVFSLADALWYIKKENLIHIPFGLLLIWWKKMSSRKGDIIKVKDVIKLVVDKILSDYGDRIDKNIALKLAIAAIIINDLKNDPIKDINFDINKMTQLQWDTGIYLIYSYVRLKNLIGKIKESLQVKEDEFKFDLLSKEEKDLLKDLEKFIYYYILAYKQGKPNFIISHLFKLVKAFNSRYSNTEKIINLSDDYKISKLNMLRAIKSYLDIVFTTFKLPIDVERI